MNFLKLFYSLLNNKGKKLFFANTFGSFLLMLVEIFSVSLIFPAIGIILNKNLNINFDFLNFQSFINNYEKEQLLIYFLIFFILVFFLKACFSLLILWFNLKFQLYIKKNLNLNLLNNFINLSYERYLKYHKTELINNVVNEINFIATSAKHLLVLITETFVIIGVIIFFTFIDFQITAIFITMVFFITLFAYYYRKRLFIYGKNRNKSDQKIIYFLNQTIDGFRELKISEKFEYYLLKFEVSLMENIKTFLKSSFLLGTPRQVIDVLFIFVLTTNILIVILFSSDFEADIFKLLGFYAIIGFRLIPSINRILTSLGGINLVNYSIEKYSDLEKILIKNRKPYKERSNINIENITFRNLGFKYSESDKPLFENFNDQIYKNQKIGISGPSGSGKTSLVNLLIGLLEPTEGEIYIEDINKKKFQNNLIKFSYVPQDPFLFDTSIKQNITMELDDRKVDKKLLEKVLSDSQINEFIKNFNEGLDTKIGVDGISLSGGQKQRLAIARALYQNNNILIFDEITASLDSYNRDKIINIINQINDKTIFIISHINEDLKICDKIIEL